MAKAIRKIMQYMTSVFRNALMPSEDHLSPTTSTFRFYETYIQKSLTPKSFCINSWLRRPHACTSGL